MLNYTDSDATLEDFYGAPAPVPDVDALRELPLAAKIDELNRLFHARAKNYNFDELDHTDPLAGGNVVDILLNSGTVASPRDENLNRFLVSSQRFDSLAYLSAVHRDTPMEQLVLSLNRLDGTIRGHTKELKAVLENNYVDFVACKRAIDDILVAFKTQKTRSQENEPRVFNPGRKKSTLALAAELEALLNNLNLASTLMIRPTLEHRGRENKVVKLIEFAKKNKAFFEYPKKLAESLAKRDLDAFTDDYNGYTRELEHIEQRQALAMERARKLGDAQARLCEQDLVLENTAVTRVSRKVDAIAAEYRKRAFADLLSMEHEVKGRAHSDAKFMELVDKLHRLDAGKSPIHDFLGAQLDKMKADLHYQHAKFDSKFGAAQKKLVDYLTSLAEQREGGSFVGYIGEKFDAVEQFYRASKTTLVVDAEKERQIQSIFGSSENLDLLIINETWLVLSNYVNFLEETFTQKMAPFVKNYLHYAAEPFNVDPENKLCDSFVRLAKETVVRMVAIFDTDASANPTKVSPQNYTNFLPHNANSVSAVFYLSDIANKLGAVFNCIGLYVVAFGNSRGLPDTNKHVKSFKEALALVDQHILEAVCATWVNDCSQFYDLEDWEKYSALNKGKTVVFTKLMQTVQYYELYVLEKIAQMLMNRSYGPKLDVRIVAGFPSKRVLISLEIQFMRSLNVLLDSVMKRYALEKQGNSDTDQNIFKVLSMNNFHVLESIIFPLLLVKFDELFDKLLSKQKLKLFADVDNAKLTILEELNENEKAWIENATEAHFSTVAAAPQELMVDPFIFKVLMHFVRLVHTIKPITDIETFTGMMHTLQGHFLLKFLQCLRVACEQESLIVHILGNLKLDLDFFVDVFEVGERFKLDEHSLELVQLAVDTMDNVERIFTDLDYTPEQLNEQLTLQVRHSENEFSCFM